MARSRSRKPVRPYGPVGSSPTSSASYHAPVAQWMRATDCGSVGRGFKSSRAYQKMTNDNEYSSLAELFDCLVETEGAKVDYEHGETIYKEGEPDNKIYRILAGGVSQSQRIPNGKLLTYQILLTGDIFSTFHLSSSVVNQPCTAKALVGTTLQEVLRDPFRDRLMNNPGLALDVVDMISDELQSRDRTLQNQISLSAKERIHSILRKLAPLGEETEEGEAIGFLTRKELAEMAGMTEETVTRSLGQLEEEGLLEKNRGKVVLL